MEFFSESSKGYVKESPFGRINCIIKPSSKYGGLYIGNFGGAEEISVLKKLKIKAVLNCLPRRSVSYPKEIIQDYLIIAMLDQEDFNIKKYFSDAINFIHENRKKHSVLVHCFAGVSRSATLVIAYLMRVNRKSFEENLSYVKSRRQCIEPNPGFCKQLIMFIN